MGGAGRSGAFGGVGGDAVQNGGRGGGAVRVRVEGMVGREVAA